MKRQRALGFATVAVLKAVRSGRCFGLDIMEATGLPSGTVYPTLGRMEDRGFLDPAWEDEDTAKQERRPRRRYYRLTPAGETALDEALTHLGSLVSPHELKPITGEEG